MRRLDVNNLIITSHAKERFVERYRKKNPYTTRTKEEILATMRSFINKSEPKKSWNVVTRPDLYEYRNHQHTCCYFYKGWIFVVVDGDGEDEGQRKLLTCKRLKREQN